MKDAIEYRFLGASGFKVPVLDMASAVTPPYPYYPYWNGQFAERDPAPVPTSRAADAAS